MTPIQMIQRGALVVINHSGGKDSQAMLATVRRYVPADQILVIHAHLDGVEWEGTAEHVERYLDGLAYLQVSADKTFLDMVESRQMFPSPQYRQCTSDLKRGPIEKAIRHYLKANPRFGGQVVNCMGLRAEESGNRAKAKRFKLNARNSKAGRQWYDWLPIHRMTETQVFDTIRRAGQVPHWAYSVGMTRLSCCFCIMASKADLQVAAKHNPIHYAEIVATERRIGHTLQTRKGEPIGLEAVTGIAANPLPQAA